MWLYSESNFLGVSKFDPYQYCQYLKIINWICWAMVRCLMVMIISLKRMNFQLTTEVWSLLITLSLLVSKLSLYTGYIDPAGINMFFATAGFLRLTMYWFIMICLLCGFVLIQSQLFVVAFLSWKITGFTIHLPFVYHAYIYHLFTI